VSRAETTRLFEEGSRRLWQSYQQKQSWPSPLWPVWDEWALLYAEHYRDRSFSFPVALPENGGQDFELQWNTAITKTTTGKSVFLSSRQQTVELPQSVFHALGRCSFGSPDALVAQIAGVAAPGVDLATHIRVLIAHLAGSRLLQIKPHQAGDA
jgi:hypothetical protein